MIGAMATDPRVDGYLAGLPLAQRDLLQHLREQVARIVPEAEETISHAMPAFRYDGRFSSRTPPGNDIAACTR
jgi:uncharacterized protein YdhG (YjbR/CyaY superfamily)